MLISKNVKLRGKFGKDHTKPQGCSPVLCLHCAYVNAYTLISEWGSLWACSCSVLSAASEMLSVLQ